MCGQRENTTAEVARLNRVEEDAMAQNSTSTGIIFAELSLREEGALV